MKGNQVKKYDKKQKNKPSNKYQIELAKEQIQLVTEENEQMKQKLDAALQENERLNENLEESVHHEISLRVEIKRLAQANEVQAKALESEKKEHLKWKNKCQEVLAINEEIKNQLRNEADLMNQIKTTQKELNQYKVKTFDILDSQKGALAELVTEYEQTTQKSNQLKKELLKVRKEHDDVNERLNKLRARHNQLMNTKMMKWTGAYWKLRKKLRLTSK
ncbi:hypothetical protein [Listeria rustica]|uniref:Uncharacterized protein n=1 Tax=Listeria rustica TaxID=2713503 RepID=A0A7W1YGG5_9LIST|nr:hypothetical protein [Listeria rustica]MBA3926760.1 hypothetical protein [Listeria rustica]